MRFCKRKMKLSIRTFKQNGQINLFHFFNTLFNISTHALSWLFNLNSFIFNRNFYPETGDAILNPSSAPSVFLIIMFATTLHLYTLFCSNYATFLS